MFKTIVFACLVISPTDCWEYLDTRGPYESRDVCIKRAYEIGNSIMEITQGNVRPKKFRCEKLKGTKL